MTTSAGSASGFQLTFASSKRSPLHTLFLLAGGYFDPLMRVILIVTVNGTAERADRRRHHPPGGQPSGNDTGQSTLTVTGEDLSVMMGLHRASRHPVPGDAAEAGWR